MTPDSPNHGRGGTRRQADETILDQRDFSLDAAAHEKFLAMLDTPATPSPELIARMNRKPSWEC
jgi:uncharacterized protein (DUF1778 family)